MKTLPLWIHKDFRFDKKSFESADELCSFVEESYPEATDLINSWMNKDGVIEVKTSGSTGSPKIVQLSREQMMASARATGGFFNLGPKSSALLCLPLKYIAGKMMLVRALTLGWHLHGVQPEVELDFQKDIQFDFAAMTPLQVTYNMVKLLQIETLLVGGGPVGQNLKDNLKAYTTRAFASYGMTETSTHVALRPLNPAAAPNYKNETYTALPGVFFRVDERDCLVIHCPRIADEDIITNDVIELISETSFIWKGRFDNVINSGGVKFFPEEVEQKFSRCMNQRFFAAGMKDDVLGQKLIFVVEGQKNDNLLIELKQHQINSKNRIKKIEVPKQLVFVSSFAETETRKIDRLKTLKMV